MTRVVIVLTAVLTGTIAIAIAVATIDFENFRLKSEVLSETPGSRPTRQLPDATPGEEPYVPRDAEPGCEWIPQSGHGIAFLAQYCSGDSGFTRLVPIKEGFAVETERGVSDLPRIEIFHKDPAQSVEDAIREQLLSELKGSAAEGCVVKTSEPEEPTSTEETMTRYAIVATGDYLDQYEKRLAEDPSYHPCGYYGPRESIAYFISSPAAPDKFLYLTIGQDAPPFDENSIRFLDEAGLIAGCEETGGTWLSMYNECEYAFSSWCGQHGGTFAECESACRHDLNAQVCTLQCVPVCGF